jgi:hypothetical protein
MRERTVHHLYGVIFGQKARDSARWMLWLLVATTTTDIVTLIVITVILLQPEVRVASLV